LVFHPIVIQNSLHQRLGEFFGGADGRGRIAVDITIEPLEILLKHPTVTETGVLL